jgi:bromodomain-containing protein 7/9
MEVSITTKVSCSLQNFAVSGSLRLSVEDPFSILSIFVPDPPTRPYLNPIYPSNSPWNPLPAPTNIPTPAYRPSPKHKTSLKTPKRRHWTVTRNTATRVNKIKEKDDEDDVPAWQLPREAHTVDFGAYSGLTTEMGYTELGTEETFFDAIREDMDELMDVDESDPDEYWTAQSAAKAQDYIRDVVYGGVDGLAYVRSLAEFVSPPTSVCALLFYFLFVVYLF